MKSTLTILLVFSFVGIAVFGTFAMNHGAEYGHNGCIAATAHKTSCPKEENSFAFFAFHLAAFKSFSTATFGDNLANMIFLLFALILMIGFGFTANARQTPPVLATNYRHRQFLQSRFSPFQQKLTHWLALHENSPAI